MDARTRKKLQADKAQRERQAAEAANPKPKTWQLMIALPIAMGIIIVILLGVIRLVVISEDNNKVDIKIHGLITDGKIIDVTPIKGGTHAEIKFMLGERPYICKISCLKDTKENEVYRVVYDKRNPFNCYVDFYEMKFDTSVVLTTATGTITETHAKEESNFTEERNSVTVEYFVEGKRYTRYNEVSYAQLDSFLVGDAVTVFYNSNNPGSALAIPRGRVR